MTMPFTTAEVLGSLPAILAYVGPGPALNMAWALVGLLLTLFAAGSAVLFWPLRVAIRKFRERRPSQSADAPAEQ